MKSHIVSALISALLLTSCAKANQEPANSNINRTIPINCQSTKMLQAFLPDVKNPEYIPTKWQPAAGTDLAIAIDNGGIACTYGLAEAGIGTTVYWVENAENIFTERIKNWQSSGFTEFDIPNLQEKFAYINLNSSQVAEIHSAAVNFLIDKVWIQINCSWAYSNEDLLPLIEKAVASTLSP
ncbi:MAG: hypothetical protein RLZZ378_228 [Actinomycetota bacterium]